MMRCFHTVGKLDTSGWGLTQAVIDLTNAIVNSSDEVELIISSFYDDVSAARLDSPRIRLMTTKKNVCGIPILNDSEISMTAGPIQLCHDHGQWLPINHASAMFAARNKIPRLISPHGMLSPWALNFHKWRKSFAWRAYAKRDLNQACVLHATSDLEADELRDLGCKQPIAVIANGLDIWTSNNLQSEAYKPFVLFLSRIHPKKGINDLLEAWESINPRDCELIVAGPDEVGILSQSRLPTGVRYIGPVQGEEKMQLMSKAKLFVLPSYSENFGLVVAESLMAGTPVITTRATPWSGLTTNQCGWWIPTGVDSLQECLKHALGLPNETLRKMGVNGRKYVVDNFEISVIGRQMLDVYRWVIFGGAAPLTIRN